MSNILVKAIETSTGWSCDVCIKENNGETRHKVQVDKSYLEKLGGGEIKDLVQRSFEFLLKRESKEMILRSFDLPLIQHYFPNYEKDISKKKIIFLAL